MAVYPFDQMPAVVKTYAKAVEKGTEAIVKAMADTGLGVIADATPVDTTKAVSNWRVTHGTPAEGDIPPLVAGSEKGSGAGAARAMVKAKGRAVISTYKLSRPLFITNRVPYIGVLEYGDSKHVPSGMVAKGLQAMRVRGSSIKLLKAGGK